MASLIEQLEMLDKQKSDLLKKIMKEEERNKKLARQRDVPSIERLEALIEPITQYLDFVFPDPNILCQNRKSLRELVTEQFEKEEAQRLKNNKRYFGTPHKQRKYTPISIGRHGNTIIGNEEIFVTLLGIIKKQDVRISELEEIIKVKNNVYQGPHAGESWNYS